MVVAISTSPCRQPLGVLRGLAPNDGPIFCRSVLHVVELGALFCLCLHSPALLSLLAIVCWEWVVVYEYDQS